MSFGVAYSLKIKVTQSTENCFDFSESLPYRAPLFARANLANPHERIALGLFSGDLIMSLIFY